jgi:hypothetical protein
MEAWKENWNEFLKSHPEIVFIDGKPSKIDLADIDFWIPPLLGANADSMKAIEKHNSKLGIF